MKKQKGFKLLVVLALVTALLLEVAVLPENEVSAKEVPAEETVRTVSVTSKALNAAKVNVKLYLNEVKMKKKAFTVKGKVNGKKETIVYIPSEEIVTRAGGVYARKKKKVTVSAATAKLTFTLGKNKYTFSFINEEGENEKFTLKLGKSVEKDGQIYIPVENVELFAGLIGCKSDHVLKKKTLKVTFIPKEEMGDLPGDLPGGVLGNFPGKDVPVIGGWSDPANISIPEEAVQYFKEQNESREGGEKIVPVACIGEQLVNGINYKFLCRFSNPSKDEPDVYGFMTVYFDFTGDIEEKSDSIIKTNIETNIFDEQVGGWKQSTEMTLTEEYKALFDLVVEEKDGFSFEPIALVASQLVNGYNLCILCKAKLIHEEREPEGVPEYAFAYIYVDPLLSDPELIEIKLAYDSSIEVETTFGEELTDADYKCLSGCYYAVMTEAGLARVLEDMEQLPNGEFRTNVAVISTDMTVTRQIESLGYVILRDGAVLTIENGGLLSCSVEIQDNCEVIVKEGGMLYTTQSNEECFMNYGKLTVEKGGELLSRMGGHVNNRESGTLVLDGEFHCGCIEYDNVKHLWFINVGTVLGEGTVFLYQATDEEDMDYYKAETEKLLQGSNVKVVVSEPG